MDVPGLVYFIVGINRYKHPGAIYIEGCQKSLREDLIIHLII
jgi:hypothetical protein